MTPADRLALIAWLREAAGTAVVERGDHHAMDRLTDAADALEADSAALEFYASPDTYFAISFAFDPPCGDFRDDFDDVGEPPAAGHPRLRPGRRARAALAGEAP